MRQKPVVNRGYQKIRGYRALLYFTCEKFLTGIEKYTMFCCFTEIVCTGQEAVCVCAFWSVTIV